MAKDLNRPHPTGDGVGGAEGHSACILGARRIGILHNLPRSPPRAGAMGLGVCGLCTSHSAWPYWASQKSFRKVSSVHSIYSALHSPAVKLGVFPLCLCCELPSNCTVSFFQKLFSFFIVWHIRFL